MSESAPSGVERVVDAALVREFAGLLATAAGPGDDAGRVELIRAVEELKCAGEARQAVETVALDASQRAVQAAAGERPERLGRGVAAQVALARRVSLFQGQRLLGLAKVLDAEMPHTMAAFKSGRISQWRATIVARETAMLEREERAQVDEQLAGRIETMGDRELAGAAASLAARLDPASVARRRGKAEEERAVTIRPAPDTMTYVTALLPVAQGVAVHAALSREAATRRASGDPRSQGQVMADTLVERVTGQASAAAVPAAVTVVLSDAALLTGADDDALLAGRHGGGVVTPIPAELARELVLASLTQTTQTSLKRLYQAPTGRLVALESTSRCFPAGLAELVRIRDEVCRTPWCDAPIRHTDHVVPHDEGGPTTFENAQGLCEACNHTKQATGWTARPGPEGVVDTTTPTGHRYRSLLPTRPPPQPSRMEIWFRDRLTLAELPESA